MKPKSPTLLFLLAFIFCLSSCQTEKPPTAINPKASSYNMQLGLAYLKQGNRQRAKQKLLTALEQNPNSPYTNEALGYYFEQTKELNQAEFYYNKALQLTPNSGAILNNYGSFLCHQKRYTEANVYFLKAAQDPHYLNTALAYENAGICALAAKKPQTAKKYFEIALEQDPSLKKSSKELVKLY
jgi:type IV pilus assembly protein PilF